MKVFLAGATGAIGRQLVPLLVAAGHDVTGLTRSRQRAAALKAAGAEPAIADALDREAITAAMLAARPDAVIHELTSIPALPNPRTIERDFLLNDRLRTDGTRNLLAAAHEAGAQRIVAQSIAFSYARGPAGTVHVESDPLLTAEQASKSFRRSAQALRELEASVGDARGIVLRYGYFYGPGTSYARDGKMTGELRRRRMPIVGDGGGVWSFVHVEDAARATLAALRHDGPACFNVVDDEPAPVAQWLPALASAVGAPRPWRIPAWLARPLAGGYGIEVMTKAQGASNALAQEQLGWQPRHRSWREGFRTAL